MRMEVVDSLAMTASRIGFRPLAGVGFVPVLHVERLHDEGSFDRVLEFSRTYEALTSRRAIATVITPVAPILADELARKGFSQDAYRDRIEALAEHADIGLHGHFLRGPEGAYDHRPVHNYWSDTALVAQQVNDECRWLEVHGLMRTRVYSGGWWYSNRTIVGALVACGFRFDFTPSVGKYNRSPTGYMAYSRHPTPTVFEVASDLVSAWAVSGICGSRRRSAVPRRTIAAFGRRLFGPNRVVTLYSHDWDMDVASAVRTINDLKLHGARFVSLSELCRMRDAENPEGGR